jgi:hypothetical protein
MGQKGEKFLKFLNYGQPLIKLPSEMDYQPSKKSGLHYPIITKYSFIFQILSLLLPSSAPLPPPSSLLSSLSYLPSFPVLHSLLSPLLLSLLSSILLFFHYYFISM